jgi:dipeptidase D
MTFISKLEPAALWSHFDQILKIPRGSKKEDKIRQFLIDQAEAQELEYKVDPTGNVVVSKPASPGKEGCPITILQSHMDMVQEKNSDVSHDFETDRIRARFDGVHITATGTTLGADNGIGIAAMLAVMESTDLIHGPMEFLFTVDEETGLTGAKQLDATMLEGRRLINLDSEEEESLCVGCAGGADSALTVTLAAVDAPAEATALRIRLAGMHGGHSGIDIHLQRGNAIQLLARALYAVSLSTPFELAGFEGGSAHNAIPREAMTEVVIRRNEKETFVEALEAELAGIRAEYQATEPDTLWEIDEIESPGQTWDRETAARVLQLLTALPHGVTMMSNDIPGLVETSTNLATVKPGDGTLEVGLSSRSSVASALTALRQKIRATADLCGASVEEEPGYPGWKPDMDSELLRVVRSVHQRELGVDPEIEAVHAGLECGLIGEMIPGMDMISIGPDIEFPHSPNERVKVSSVGKFYRLLTATLEELATGC